MRTSPDRSRATRRDVRNVVVLGLLVFTGTSYLACGGQETDFGNGSTGLGKDSGAGASNVGAGGGADTGGNATSGTGASGGDTSGVGGAGGGAGNSGGATAGGGGTAGHGGTGGDAIRDASDDSPTSNVP